MNDTLIPVLVLEDFEVVQRNRLNETHLLTVLRGKADSDAKTSAVIVG